MQIAECPDLEHFVKEEENQVYNNSILDTIIFVMINEKCAKWYCSEDISLIENYQDTIADEKRMWDIHHRRESDSEGRTLFTHKRLKEMNLYYNRPAAELVFVTRAMHKKLHREQMENIGKNVGKKYRAINSKKGAIKRSIPILQFAKSGELVKEWPSAHEAQHQLGIHQSHICACLKGCDKFAGGYVWTYAHGRRLQKDLGLAVMTKAAWLLSHAASFVKGTHTASKKKERKG